MSRLREEQRMAMSRLREEQRMAMSRLREVGAPPAILSRFRDFYGSHPLHLLLVVASFAVFGYLVATFTPAAFWNHKVWWQSIVVWFAAAVILHDLVLYPAYALADRLLRLPAKARRNRDSKPRVPPLNYVRIPAMASALTLVVFLPGIIKQGAHTYISATGMTQDGFLGRWLLLSATFFFVSAIAYAVRLSLKRKRKDMGGSEPSPDESTAQRPTAENMRMRN